MNARRCMQYALWILVAGFALEANAWIRSPAVQFAEMPPGTAHPEGITADAKGNLYVADFDVSKASGPGNVVVFNHAGKLLRKLDVSRLEPAAAGPCLPAAHATRCWCSTSALATSSRSIRKAGAATRILASIGPPASGHGINGADLRSSRQRLRVRFVRGRRSGRSPPAAAPRSPWVSDPATLGTIGRSAVRRQRHRVQQCA